MSGGRAFQIGPAHEGGGPGRGNPPDVEVFRLGNSGTIVSLWHFCISFSDAYTEGRGVTAWRRSRPAAQRAPTRRSESRTAGTSDTSFAFWRLSGPTALALQLEERRLVPAAGAPLGAVVTDGSRFRGGADPRPKASPGEV